MNTNLIKRSLMALAFAALLGACGEPPAPADEHGEEAGAEEFERGPHRGRMLRDGDFAVEITIFEDGVEPQFRVFPYLNDKPIEPGEVNLAMQLGRLGGRTDTFAFAPAADYLLGDGVVHEPHSFDVDVSASYAGATHKWTYASYEGRTTFEGEQADAAGVKVEAAGPAEIAETPAITCTGLVRRTRVPSPSCPPRLDPAAHAVPSVLRNRLWFPPALMAATPLSTWTGVSSSCSVPAPNCPKLFAPVAQAEPSVFRNMLYPGPAEIAVTPVNICTGLISSLRVPLPN